MDHVTTLRQVAKTDLDPPRVVGRNMCIQVVNAPPFAVQHGNPVEDYVDRLAEPERNAARRVIGRADHARCWL